MRHSLLPPMIALASVLLNGCSDRPDPTESGADPTASSASGVPLAAAKVTLHFPFQGTFGISFTSPCTGGAVTGEGEVVGQINIVDDGLHYEETGTVIGTVTDQATGITYTFRNTYHDSFNTPSGPAPNGTFGSSAMVIAFPTTGSGEALGIHVTIRTTIDANGITRATVEAINYKCLG
jgi:hypothetical protein